MNLFKTIPFLITFFFCSRIFSQVTKKSAININVVTNDSVRSNCRSNQSLLIINYQTGETTIKVKSETFTTNDTILQKVLFQKTTEVELHFEIKREMLDVLNSDNIEHAAEAPGMLYINNHFQSVSINYSIYNKNGNTIDFANNNVLLSLQCSFYPMDFQLEDLDKITHDPILLWVSKQPVNFIYKH